MKYKLINTKTKEETICEKVTIDGFDYYVSDAYGKPAIATNNPNIDVPKVVDEVEKMSWDMVNQMTKLEGHYERIAASWGFRNGYNKSQETHPFSEEDVEFFVKKVLEDAKKSVIWSEDYYKHLTKELLQLWKEQRTKIVYYE